MQKADGGEAAVGMLTLQQLFSRHLGVVVKFWTFHGVVFRSRMLFLLGQRRQAEPDVPLGVCGERRVVLSAWPAAARTSRFCLIPCKLVKAGGGKPNCLKQPCFGCGSSRPRSCALPEPSAAAQQGGGWNEAFEWLQD